MQSCFIEISASVVLAALLELKYICTANEDKLKQNKEIKEMALKDFLFLCSCIAISG